LTIFGPNIFVFIDFHFPIFGQPLRQKTPRIQSTDIFNISLNLFVEKKNGQFSFFLDCAPPFRIGIYTNAISDVLAIAGIAPLLPTGVSNTFQSRGY